MLLNPQCIIDSCNLNGVECRPVQQEVDERHVYGRLVYPIPASAMVRLLVCYSPSYFEDWCPETGFDSFWPAIFFYLHSDRVCLFPV